jgi:aminopeptidase N
LLAATARTDDHVALVRGLFDGSTTISGLDIDTELRWGLLIGLVGMGAATDAEIEAEQDRDATDAGARHAATARAARPTAEAKAEAWRLATEDDSLPNAMNMAIIRGFAHPNQTDLLRPYIAKYFSMIDDLWARRSSEIAQNAVVGLFPIAEQSTLDAADEWLAQQDLPPALHRLVLEGRDTTARCLRNQARDAAAGAGNSPTS